MRQAPRRNADAVGGPPPRVLVATSVVVLAVATGLAVLGATRTGITTDEPIHVMRLHNYFETGWYALDWDYGGDGPRGDDTNTFVYAPVAMLLLHAWSVLWGVEGWGELATTSHAYDVRHLGVVAISLVGMVAVAAIGRVLLRHWGWGLVAAAVLAATPMWTGHAMVNVKDVPVATGHTLATLGLLLFVRPDPPGVRFRLARAGCLAGGLVLALGTRPGMWPGLLALLAVAAAGVLWSGTSRRGRVSTLAEGAAACAAAAAVLIAAYPRLFGSPLLAVSRTTESSSAFLDNDQSDRLYVPRHLLQDLPTLLLAFVVTGTIVAGALLVRHRRQDRVRAARGALVGVQAFALPVVAIVLGSDLYHGLRQLLFALPALAVLAACGMAWWLAPPRRHVPVRASQSEAEPAMGRRAFGRVSLVLTAAAALALPTVDQVTMQPYQTSYVNLATDVLSGRDVSPEARLGDDYWRASIAELVEAAPLDRPLICKATTGPESGVAFPFVNAGATYSTSRSLDCREEANGPLAPIGLPVVRPRPAAAFDAVFIGALPPNCTALDEVTRSRHGFEVVVSTLGRCTIDPTILPRDGVRARDPALGTTLAGDLWRYATGGWQQWPGQPELISPVTVATLALRPAAACARRGCTLLVTGQAPVDVVVSLGAERVAAVRDPYGSLRVPISAQQATDDVLLSLSRRSGEPLGMRMTGLSLEARPAPATTRGSR